MADWKLLGEVPDSEDEDAFQSQELPSGHDDTKTPGGAAPDANGIDIWEFPASQDENKIPPKIYAPKPLLSRNGSAHSSPLSSVQSVDGLLELDDVLLDYSEDIETQEASNTGPSNQSDTQICIELANQTPSAFDDFVLEHGLSPLADRPLDEQTALPSQELGIIQNNQELQRKTVRLERSLRPRKPIQEHPYLLENAHYSSLIRKHGMRPVQMEMARATESGLKNAQDSEFQDDSQEKSIPDFNDSSQSLNPNDAGQGGGVSIFSIPSSSPPKTSPWITHGRFSSNTSSQGDTDNTSNPDEDLPALDELLSKPSRKTSHSTKRSSTALSFSARKRRRQEIIDSDPVDTDMSEKDTQARPLPFGTTLTSGPLPPIPRLRLNARKSVDVSPVKNGVEMTNGLSSEDEGSNEEEPRERRGSVSDESAGGNPKYMSKIGKRIKGVLPASWLRLDQKASRDKAQKDMYNRQRNRTPEREVRRGVAQPRTHGKDMTSVASPWFLDSSEDEEAVPRPASTRSAQDSQSRLVLLADETPTIPVDDSSDSESIIEHDTIDAMFAGQTQRRTSGDAPRRQKAGSSIVKRRNTKPRQQKIIPSMNQARSASGTASGEHRHRHYQRRSHEPLSNTRGSGTKSFSKPLSVLDVIEPDAPSFLRIAARIAKTRVNQGRNSASKKVIRFASRRDHADAISSLNEWKAGFIPQRQEVSTARQERREMRKQESRKPLAESALNKPPATRSAPKQKGRTIKISQKSMKATNFCSARYLPSQNHANVLPTGDISIVGNDESAAITEETLRNERIARQAPTDRLRPARPALLEAEELGKVAPLGFDRRKKALDTIFRKKNRESSVHSSDDEFSIDRILTPDFLSKISTDHAAIKVQPETLPRRRKRARKPRNPGRLEVNAPRFNHAEGPLPTSYAVDVEPLRPHSGDVNAKLSGLGSYGTKYTTHFEIFPLDPGVYFHQSTLLGSGVIEECQKNAKKQMLLTSRPRVTFQFDTYSCRWSDWNDQTSSELGIVLDLISEELEKPDGISASGESTVVEASKFISRYATTALSFTNDAAIKSFITRVLNVSRSCHSRISTLVSKKAMSEKTCQTAAKVYDHLSVLVFISLLICSDDDSLSAEKFQVEDLLRSLSAGLISNLLLLGIDRLKGSYAQLQINGRRERGLREDSPHIHSWTLVMQILEVSHIPRGSFWDVLKQVIATNDQVSNPDAQIYERIWETVFAVLPLTEFSPSGVLVVGKRHEATSDGWIIVQQVLRQVFTLYRENTRQAPGFNDYCRALMSRCHYLVQQWGWRRSGIVVGTIFDFFGSHNLEHLRNEEVNASPQFLELLSGAPSLAVEPEDRCFHIFLKLLALSIQKLRAAGAVNDIRNLVARTTPNHNRQHLKEQVLYERDLAALRNHHDLLATLFWSAPADVRPSPVLLERLVAPETSHKEASLINIRCWSQLCRFIVAKGEASTAFKPFRAWRDGFFRKMVQQFDSAASDIQQQLLALPSDVRLTISDDMVASMISINKAAASDVLHACVGASLDVMKHAVDLEAATFCLNALQLQQIYKMFTVHRPELGWDTLRAAISTLDIFLDRIAEFKENEESQQSESQILDSVQADDAVLQIHESISQSYFSMVRCALSNSLPGSGSGETALEGFRGVEHVVTVAARLAANLINSGIIRPHDLFQRGPQKLFDGPIHKLDLERRRYLVLVLVILLKAGIDDFSTPNLASEVAGNDDFTLCQVWLLLLVRPSEYLAYESQMADLLQQRGEYFMPRVDSGLANSPNYESNSKLFEAAISAMRRSIQNAGPDPDLKRARTDEHSKALKLVMEQMKDDLRTTSSQPVTHVPYVAFARQIISHIRAHGSEICTLDSFYYQISRDYSPSSEDPQLQVATMVSYGLRLQDGEAKVAQQVFFFLFNNFKLAVIGNSLTEEKKLLQKGMMKDMGISRFILGKMLPAIIGAAASKVVAYPLLDLYVWAASHRLGMPFTTYRLTDADLSGMKAIFESILGALQGWIADQAPLTAARLHTLRSFFTIGNLLGPSICEYSLNNDTLSGIWGDVVALVQTLDIYGIACRDTLGNAGFSRSSPMRFDELFAAASLQDAQSTSMTDIDVAGFTSNIKEDVDRSWIEIDGRISIQMPGKPRGGVGGAAQGVVQAQWDVGVLIAGVMEQLFEWQRWKKKMDGDYTWLAQEPEAIMF